MISSPTLRCPTKSARPRRPRRRRRPHPHRRCQPPHPTSTKTPSTPQQDGSSRNSAVPASENSQSRSQRTSSRSSPTSCRPLAAHNVPCRNYIDQHKVAIVCSARSGSTKALGTTNLLLRSAAQALEPRIRKNSASGKTTPVTRGLFGANNVQDGSPPASPPPRDRTPPNNPSTSSSGFSLTPLAVPLTGQPLPEFNATVDIIREEHLKTASASVRDPNILQELIQEIENDCDWLRSFLSAAQVCFSFTFAYLPMQSIEYIYPLRSHTTIGHQRNIPSIPGQHRELG